MDIGETRGDLRKIVLQDRRHDELSGGFLARRAAVVVVSSMPGFQSQSSIVSA